MNLFFVFDFILCFVVIFCCWFDGWEFMGLLYKVFEMGVGGFVVFMELFLVFEFDYILFKGFDVMVY